MQLALQQPLSLTHTVSSHHSAAALQRPGQTLSPLYNSAAPAFGIKKILQRLHPGKLGEAIGNLNRRLMGNQLSTLKEGQIARLNLSELPLAALASGILLYVTGQETYKAETGQPYDKSRWAKMLAEGGMLYGILATTQNLYPVITGGILAYKWGKASSILQKMYETIDIGISMAASAVGILFGMGVTASSRTHDVKALHQHLQSSEMLSQLKHFSTQITPPQQTPQQAGQYQQRLKDIADKLYTLIDSKKNALNQNHAQLTNTQASLSSVDRKRILKETQQLMDDMKPMIDALSKEFETQHLANMSDVGKRQLAELAQTVKRSTAGLTKMARALNPVFGAIILGVVAQAFISKPLKALMGKMFPGLNTVNVEMPERTFIFDNAHQHINAANTNNYYAPAFDPGSELSHHLIGSTSHINFR